MAETLGKQASALEQTYMKYFTKLDKIDSIYHRHYGNGKKFIAQVSTKDINPNSEVETMLRGALLLKEDGLKNLKSRDLANEQLLKIHSLLANLPKLTNIQLKKAILFVFRRYATNQTYGYVDSMILLGQTNKLHKMVAQAAIANGLGTTEDFYEEIIHSKQTQYMDAIITQAKADIKSELANPVPEYNEIDDICTLVYNAAKDAGLPKATLDLLAKEFDADKIIAGGEHIANFEKTIEIDHAEAEKNKIKAAWADKNEQENKELRKENENLRKNLKTLSVSAEQMHASVFSRGVNKYKKLIAQMTADLSNLR